MFRGKGVAEAPAGVAKGIAVLTQILAQDQARSGPIGVTGNDHRHSLFGCELGGRLHLQHAQPGIATEIRLWITGQELTGPQLMNRIAKAMNAESAAGRHGMNAIKRNHAQWRLEYIAHEARRSLSPIVRKAIGIRRADDRELTGNRELRRRLDIRVASTQRLTQFTAAELPLLDEHDVWGEREDFLHDRRGSGVARVSVEAQEPKRWCARSSEGRPWQHEAHQRKQQQQQRHELGPKQSSLPGEPQDHDDEGQWNAEQD